MKRNVKLSIALACMIALGGMTLAGPASASNLTILFSGLDLYYDGQTGILATSPVIPTSNATVSTMDELVTMSFIKDGTNLGTFTSDIWADIELDGVFNIPAAGGMITVNSPGPKVNLFAGNNFLNLNWDSPVEIAYDGQHMNVTGSAGGAIVGQSLPFGQTMVDPLRISFSTQILDMGPSPAPGLNANGGNNDGYLYSFHSFGTGEVSGGTTVPEPATLLTLGFGLLGGGFLGRRRKKKN